MSRPLLLLIPPSLGKQVGGRTKAAAGSFDEELTGPRAQVLTALRQVVLSKDAVLQAKIFKAEGNLLDRAVSSATAIVEGSAPFLPSWRRYTGVVWTHLAPTTLPAQSLRRILIPSGLYGLTTGTDPIADYRLGMQGELGRLGSLRSHWKGPVTELLAKRLRGRTVVNLLPAEHAQAIDFDGLGPAVKVVDVRFVSKDGRHAVGHDAKATKGRLARALLESGLEAAADFRSEGWIGHIEERSIVVVAPASTSQRRL